MAGRKITSNFHATNNKELHMKKLLNFKKMYLPYHQNVLHQLFYIFQKTLLLLTSI